MKFLKIKPVIIFSLLLLFSVTRVYAQEGGLENPLGDIESFDALLSLIIRVSLGIAALYSTMMVIWGGFTLMTSGGNSEKVKKGKDTLVWAILGLALAFLSWAIVKFVLEALVISIGA